MKPITAILLCASVVLLGACRKDPIGDGDGAVDLHQHFISMGSSVTVTVYGQVLDEAGVPVPSALVQAGYGNESTMTDEYGVFVLQGIRAYQRMGTVRVTKPGYFTGSRSFVPVQGGNVVRIQLLTAALN